ncbi:ribonuclease catalytic domain-containing protein [Desulfovibrio ferrophilus]|uniref:Ribonuclease II n=1 Tax=Desulfovibrio ferrophilus TaxID=241368 RepID=A0A2Z6B1K4_9BACT|nr:ribonuclease catalytic domain-containing protein [Desulfovibrio ferrophilus]BBD09338.1 ribonuclease II [Desulfovibrio ferrophilus]
MSTLVRYPGPGCIVEFLHGNKPNVAWVLEEQSGRLRVLTINRREMKLPAGRILPWPGPAHPAEASREEIAHILEDHESRREELASQVDPEEIWELAQGDVDRASITWFTGLTWNEPDADHIAAMGRRMLEQKTHFKFHPPEFEVYPAQKVESRRVEEETRRQREHIVTAAQQFFHALWEARSKGRSAPEPPEGMAETLHAILIAAMADTSGSPELTIWNTVRKGLPDLPQLPMFLGQTWGVIPEHFNMQLLQEGYDWGDDWAREFDAEMDELEKGLAALAQEPEETPFISIDSASTHDIDDAFHVQSGPDNGYRLQVALACPALGWEFGSPLDRAVRERASSVYLPEGASHMMPERYGIGLFSLYQQQPKPALVLDCNLDENGNMLSMEPRCTWVRIEQNSTYQAMEEALDTPDCDPCLTLAAELGAKLRQRRIDNGAVVVDRPDPTITLEGEGAETRVLIEDSPRYDRAQATVSEFMILANSSIGQWAADRGIPMLFRTQDITLPGDAAGVWDTPEDAHRIVRMMAPTTQELTPRLHATIGAKAYAPLTSPIRRYADLMNLTQVLHALEHDDTPRWDREELLLMLPHITARTEAAGRIQRFRPRYWKLVHFKQRKKEMFSTTVVEDGQLVILAMPKEQMYVRCPRNLLGDKIYPGQRFAVRLNKVNPLTNEIRVVEALEE